MCRAMLGCVFAGKWKLQEIPCLHVYLSICLCACLSVCLSVHSSVCPPVCLSVCLIFVYFLFSSLRPRVRVAGVIERSVSKCLCLSVGPCVLLVWRVCLSVCVSDPHASGNYVQRQISRWTKQYRVAETSTIGAMEELITRLNTVMPRNIHSTTRLVHGDYRYVDLRAICSRWQWGRGEGGVLFGLNTIWRVGMGLVQGREKNPLRNLRDSTGEGGTP